MFAIFFVLVDAGPEIGDLVVAFKKRFSVEMGGAFGDF